MFQDQFNRFTIDNKVVGFFAEPITLKSGRTSHFYVNWRTVTGDAFLLDRLTDFIVTFLTNSGIEFDSLYGVPEGASKTAIIAALKLATKSPHFGPGSHAISMGRAAPKEHGDLKDRYFIGAPRGRVVVLEDSITTGGSLFKTIDQLLEAGIEVVCAIGITDRMELGLDGISVAETIAQKYGGKIGYRAMSNALELLPQAAKINGTDSGILNAITKEYEQFGVGAIRWE